MGYQGGLLVALEASTGKELWRVQEYSFVLHSRECNRMPSPAAADGIVYMGFPDGNVAAFRIRINGSLNGKIRTVKSFPLPPLWRNRLYWLEQGELYAF